MAEVMIDGILDQGLLQPQDIIASDHNPTRLAHVAARHAIRTATDNRKTAQAADVLLLAVKPQNLAEVLQELRGRIPASATVLSIVAGASMRALRTGLAHEHVVRCMPNLPCRVRRGMTVWTARGDRADHERTRTLLGVMGQELYVEHEAQVDQATAVNGTGPAIVAEFVKAMVEAAAYIGEPREVAHETVLATLIGTAEMIRSAGRDGTHVAELIDAVTSPGGTTSRALQVMKQGRFSAVVTEAIDAAHSRTLELGQRLEADLARGVQDG